MAPPPPTPLIQGSSTPSANVVAITASMQSPPAASTAAPTSAALRDCAATMPPLETTAGLRICWELLNWSRMGGLVVVHIDRRSAPTMTDCRRFRYPRKESKMAAVKQARETRGLLGRIARMHRQSDREIN